MLPVSSVVEIYISAMIFQEEVIPTLILFGLGLGLLLALGVLARRESHPARFFLVGLFTAFAFSLVPSLFHSLGRIVSPAALNLGKTAQFVLGPLALFYVRALRGVPVRRRRLLHFFPGILAAVLAWFVFPPDVYPRDHQDHARWLLRHPLGLVASLHLILYLTGALFEVRGWRGPAPARRSLSIVLALYILGMSFGLAGMLLEAGHRLAHMAIAGLVPVLAFHFILLMRQPALLGQSRSSPERSQGPPRLDAGEIGRVRGELRRLMETERLFLDEDLSLGRLAAELKLTQHQLSWFINEDLGENFYSLVNRYRVDAARKMLREEPERTVLSIALAVGFNSKSSFHTAFTRLTGQTPAAYRKNPEV